MSAIEDTRRLLQDFLAPELRELTVRIDALEKRIDTRIEALEGQMNDRFQTVDARFEGLEEQMKSRFEAVDARFESLEEQMNSRFEAAEQLASERHSQIMQSINRLADYYELRERVARIEARERAS